ncbi:hypothetical protein [Crenalkalicoccus roseus]|uniref:hypothetical protein n=1 Tax=Crenalkalicoccus roseus TaxID=1485588 RepID=UPI001081FBBC|nr:hypothetical protein [Crenalkalicoccus roseus]
MTAARRAPPRAAPPPRPAARPRGGRAPGGLARWAKVALLVGLVLLGLPLAHALLGEVVALLGGAALFGFLLGRWTLPGR